MGTVSTTPVIIRTQSGRFNLTNALSLEDFEDTQKVLSITEVFKDIQIVEVDEKNAKKLINGVKIAINDIIMSKNADFNSEVFLAFENNLIGMYRLSGDKFEPIVYLFQ